MPTRRQLANAIRALSMDAVQKANSGHPGMPMGMADIAQVLWGDYLRHNPGNPLWADRDRFVISNGHGSMLLYSLLHLTGYPMPLEALTHFRQLGYPTAGHPEVEHHLGIETTTGPLGQGLANAVGMALAERNLAATFNRPGLESGLPGYVKMLEQRLADARATDRASPAAAAFAERLEAARVFLDEKSRVRHTLPNVTFTDRMDVTMGERRIQILSYGRAVTPGDTFLYLPDERVLATGDLLVNPISFALSCYPTEWLAVLEKLDALDAAVIVPGHGLPLRDKALLRATRDLSENC